jgi:hypothetical protein
MSPHGLRGLEKVTGLPLKSFFINGGPTKSHDFRYSDAEVAHYYRQFQREALKRQLRFGTCFIGMGLKDYFQYQGLWSNKSDCCDVRGNVPAFKTSSQDIDWTERLKHAPHKEAASTAMREENVADRTFRSDNRLRPVSPMLVRDV